MAVINTITILCPDTEASTVNLDDFYRNEVLVGRSHSHGQPNQSPNNDIIINNDIVSKAHCKFYKDSNNDWYIIDDNSTNGLTFNNQKITSKKLNDGDKIYVGKVKEDPIVMIYARRFVEDGQRADDALHGVKSYVLNPDEKCVIGRSEDCDIVISHPTVSRKHCIISCENGRYYVTDNNSTNGVILNSEPLRGKQPLQQMDRISIAGFSFVFVDGCLYSSEISGGVSVSTEHLSRTVGRGDKEKLILDDINLSIEPNKFVAIIGGSGAGKTTLLNCLSGMTGYTDGEVYINGESIRLCGKSLRSLMGYVPQQDIVYDNLTLDRMLYYSAKLRMPLDVTDDDIEDKIEETLDMVELSDHRDTLISRLSGGERKRASIAVELLASPKLFFLDEPSSGLDPGTEKHLMQMLKKLADSGKTVIMITHTVQNLDLCDSVICMGRGGRLCFAGTPDEALRFFDKKSMIDVYDILYERSEFVAEEYLHYRNTRQEGSADFGIAEATDVDKGFRGSLKDFWTMTCRYTELLFNDRLRLILLLLMPIVLTPLVCIAFEADGNLYNFVLKCGLPFNRSMFPFKIASHTFSLLLSFSCAAFWTGIFNSIQEISKERPIYEREKFTGVGVIPYYFSKFFPLFVLCLIQSFCMVFILQFMSNTYNTIDGNINNTANPATVLHLSMRGTFSQTFTSTFLCVLSAMCLGLTISSIASNDMALVLCPICLMPQILFSNVVSQLSGFTLTLSNIISCKWSSLAFILAEKLADDDWGLYTKSKESAGVWTFSEVYAEERYSGTVSEAWLALVIICAVCMIVSLLFLKFRKTRTR